MATNSQTTIAYDFKEVEDDLFINPNTGDFDFVPSDNQHIRDILGSYPGWWKEFPLVGVGIGILLKAKVNAQKVEALIKQQLEADGYKVARPDVKVDTNGRGIISPNAVRINNNTNT